MDSAQFVFRGNRKVKQQYNETVKERAIAVVCSLETVKADASNSLLGLRFDVDEGELILIGKAIAEPAFYLVSGDKRCFRALERHRELAQAREKLCGRVLCLEQVIWALIKSKGFETIREKVVPACECDRALKAIFGSGVQAEEKHCLATLSSYLEELEQDCPELLAPLGKWNKVKSLGEFATDGWIERLYTPG